MTPEQDRKTAEFLQSHRNRLIGFALQKFPGCHEDAEDAFQNMVSKVNFRQAVANEMPKLRPDADLPGWCFVRMHHKMIEVGRSRFKLIRSSGKESGDASAPTARLVTIPIADMEGISDSNPTADEAAMVREDPDQQKQQILDLVNGLTNRQSQVIRAWIELGPPEPTNAEIATHLGLTENNVKGYKSQAVARLIALLAK